MENVKNNTDVIVIGGGPAGIAAAITVARAGQEVILSERGTFSGSQNMFGGAIYTQPTKEVFPDFEKEAPLERRITSHKYLLRNNGKELAIEYFDDDENKAYSVIRGKFDRYMQKQAEKEGVIFVNETVVEDLIFEGSKVVGVKTELEQYYSNIVILADGVNSLLAKKAGLRKDFEPKDVALSVKEVIKLDEQRINERFNISSEDGVACELFGEPMVGMFGVGFLYTNRESVTVGVGISLEDLAELRLKPYEVLDTVKQHPKFRNLLEGGELLEYSAHLIPEGGYKKIPKLYADGVMVVGDAAMLVNSVHFEGTNLALISGKFAGETAVEALQKGDYSKKMLSLYMKKLNNSFIIKDLFAYKDVISLIDKNKKSFLDYYLKKILQFFKIFTSVDSIPKRKLYQAYIKSFFTDRCPCKLIKEIFTIIKMVLGVICGK
ncbi:FAD-binding protein [bacterium]|nr:FAD-binding protein [bacterium]